MQVRDVVTAKPPSYDALSAALQNRLTQNRTARLTSLQRHRQLGDQRPFSPPPPPAAQKARTELGAAPGAADGQQDGELLRRLFLQRLLPSVRAALSLLAEETPLD